MATSSSSFFSDEELDMVYERCQVVMDHVDLNASSSRGHSSHHDNVTDCDEGLDKEALNLAFEKCQNMMEHIDLNNTIFKDRLTNGQGSTNESEDDYYMDGLSHIISSPPLSSSLDSGEDMNVPLMYHYHVLYGKTMWAAAYQNLNVFQQHHLFYTLHRDPSITISFVVLSADHFFIIIFDYHRDSELILGRHISGNVSAAPCPSYDGQLDDWNIFNGPIYWKHIAILYSIDAVEPDHVNTISMHSGKAKKRSHGVRDGKYAYLYIIMIKTI
ncbi:hypothetical protein L210DRAFT_3507856 [Boletus edulis BED1]|uniref:Uncharacterized protein n=1 Tax=Boletus edulis BED1 TaxID=1328754 RepID=A0AAD4BJ38_BOLED|nr:hypothetical protein L210DRAFT_3507855 [Boletus edulis BED1]KAF8431519.1 hypothetical protein L210DRAFT_3507856 [Boletus edulis BED1]